MGFTYKIHTNSGNVTFRVSIISKTQQQTRFAHAGITDQQQLKQEITKQRFETGTIESWYHLLLSIHLNKSTASNRDETFRILTNDKRGIKSTSPSQKYIHGDRTISYPTDFRFHNIFKTIQSSTNERSSTHPPTGRIHTSGPH